MNARGIARRIVRTLAPVALLASLATPALHAAADVAGRSAPAPATRAATAATRPDFTGIWRIEHAAQRLRATDGEPPLRPEAAAAYARTRAALAAGHPDFDETRACMPPGLPRIFNVAQPFEIIQRPFQVAFLFQYQTLYRTVLMTDAQPEVLLPSFMGQSVGHWDGDTLVVDSIGFKPNFVLDDAGLPHGEKLHIVERLRLLERGQRLEDRLHIEDPDTFTRPWDTVLRFRRLHGVTIVEDICPDRAQVRHR